MELLLHIFDLPKSKN